MSGRRALGYDTRFGSGWISGVAAVVLGALGLGAVLCLLFPDVLTSPETRGYYPLPAVRRACFGVCSAPSRPRPMPCAGGEGGRSRRRSARVRPRSAG